MSRCQRCDPPQDWDDLEQHAADAQHPLCVLCARSLAAHEPQACARCVERATTNLEDVEAAYLQLPEALTDRTGSRHVAPGGDALAMAAWGSDGRTGALGALLGDGMVHDEHGRDEHPHDPPSVAWTVARWEDDWRRVRGEPAADPPAHAQQRRPRAYLDGVVRRSVAYLQQHSRWAAASHPSWVEYALEVADVRGRLHGLLGLSEPREARPVCLACAGRGWSVRLDVGGDWSCPLCGETVAPVEYLTRLRAGLEAKHAG